MKNLKTYIWWMHEPIDERERQLYFEAYRRCSNIFLGFILFLCTTYLLGRSHIGAYDFPLAVYAVFGLIVLVVALIAGSWIFRHQDVSYKKRDSYYWKMIRGEALFLIFALIFGSKPFSQVFASIEWVGNIPGLDQAAQIIFGVLSWIGIGLVILFLLQQLYRKFTRKG